MACTSCADDKVMQRNAVAQVVNPNPNPNPDPNRP